MLEEKMKIREVVDKFANLEINVHEQMNLFTDDAAVKIYFGNKLGKNLKGKKEIEKFYTDSISNVTASHHANHQLLVDVNGDKAKGTLYCTIVLYSEDDGEKKLSTNYIIYEDTYVKIDDNWYIKERNSHLVITDSKEIA